MYLSQFQRFQVQDQGVNRVVSGEVSLLGLKMAHSSVLVCMGEGVERERGREGEREKKRRRGREREAKREGGGREGGERGKARDLWCFFFLL